MPFSQQRAMKVTTVRFGTDLWHLLEMEAANAGVSTSQYIREAALARAAAAAARRGDGPFDLLAGALREVTSDERDPAKRADAARVLGQLATLSAAESRSDAEALRGESGHALRRAEKALARAETLFDN